MMKFLNKFQFLNLMMIRNAETLSDEINLVRITKGNNRTLVTWTNEQKNITLKFFKRRMQNKLHQREKKSRN